MCWVVSADTSFHIVIHGQLQLSISLSWLAVLSWVWNVTQLFSSIGGISQIPRQCAAIMDKSCDCRRDFPKRRWRPNLMTVRLVCSHRSSFPHSPRSQGWLIGLMTVLMEAFWEETVGPGGQGHGWVRHKLGPHNKGRLSRGPDEADGAGKCVGILVVIYRHRSL